MPPWVGLEKTHYANHQSSVLCFKILKILILRGCSLHQLPICFHLNHFYKNGSGAEPGKMNNRPRKRGMVIWRECYMVVGWRNTRRVLLKDCLIWGKSFFGWLINISWCPQDEAEPAHLDSRLIDTSWLNYWKTAHLGEPIETQTKPDWSSYTYLKFHIGA